MTKKIIIKLFLKIMKMKLKIIIITINNLIKTFKVMILMKIIH